MWFHIQSTFPAHTSKVHLSESFFRDAGDSACTVSVESEVPVETLAKTHAKAMLVLHTHIETKKKKRKPRQF